MNLTSFKKFTFVFIIVLALSACATGDPETNTNNDNNTNKDESEQSASIGIRENITTIDPHDGSTTSANFVQNSMYERLYELGEDGEMHPALASNYEESDDGLEYVFELREGVKFHDGSDFDAEDVKANLDRILDSEGGLAAYRQAENIVDVEILDDYEIKITLDSPSNQFLDKVDGIRIASGDAIEGDVDLSQEVIGTGPFVMEEWNRGDSFVVKANEDYWESDYPKLNEITFRPVPEDGSRVAMLKAGDIDLAYPLPEKDIESLEDDDNLDVVIDDSSVVRYATLNTTKEYLEDKKVRQAMNYAIDEEQFANVVKSGYASSLDSIIPPSNSYYEAQTPYSYDLDKAKELMEEAGVADGFTVSIWGDDSSENKRAMQFIEQQLENINIEVEVEQFERGTLDDKIYSPEGPEDAEINMWYVSWSAGVGSPDNAIRPLFSTESFPSNGPNTAYYSNEKVDDLINSAITKIDEDEALEEYAEIQSIVYEDAPWLFLGVDQLVYAKNKNLKDVWLAPSGGVNLKEAYIE